MGIHYRIRIAEHLDPAWAAWFHHMQVSPRQHTTVLHGHVPHQDALYELLLKLRNLNITLLSFERLEPEPNSNHTDETG